MNKKMEEQLNGEIGGTLKTDRTEQLANVTEIDGTPFRIVTLENDNFLVLGNIRISDTYKSKDEVIKYLEYNHWEVVLKVILAMPHIQKQTEEFSKQAEQAEKFSKNQNK